MKFGYYGYIPALVRHNKELTPMAKLVYAEITANMEEQGYCKKNNAYFARILNSSKTTITACITMLREKGMIDVIIENEKETKKFMNRYITITPPCFLGGVANQSGLYHTRLSGGVELDVDDKIAKNGSRYAENPGSLLLHNNVTYIYSYKNGAIKLDRNINDQQLAYLKNIVMKFYSEKRKAFPETIDIDWEKDGDLVNGSINTLYELITRDKWDESDVKNVIHWSLFHPFWMQNLFSLRTLRSKSNNGNSKFTNLFNQWNKDRGN